ncbi:ComEC/Rec2 family competence protein [Spiroplasma melliferum]|uniref:ComEC/Rec2 family competence protein n=1 Tax=Spiroplasma melliferum TaxID=2134 RepID=UPI000C78D80C|nr:ComEC/Rec2 family competence protein [Spiroplasma melliferum]
MFFNLKSKLKFLKQEQFLLVGGIIGFNYLLLINSYWSILVILGLGFILIWQQQKIYLGLLIFVIIISALCHYYLQQPSLQENNIVYGRIQKHGNGYYYLSVGWKQYFLKTTINFNLHDQICLQGYYSNIKSASNVYELNMQSFLNANNIFYQFNITKVIAVKPGNTVLAKITKFFNSYDDLTKDTLALFLFGQKAKTTLVLYDYFIQLGVIHLLIVSGYHLNILFYILSKIFKRIMRRKGYYYIIYLFLFFYLYLLNFSFASVKAIILLSLSLFNAHFWNYKLTAKSKWNLSILLILLFFPYSFLGSGFWYSFTITWLFLNLNSKTKHYYFWQKLLYYNLMAFIFLLGWMLYFSYQLNFSSILFNLLLLPILSLIYLFSLIIVFIPPCYFIYQYFYLFLINYMVILNKINLIWNVGYVPVWYLLLYYILLWGIMNKSEFVNKIFRIFCILSIICYGLQPYFTSIHYSMTMLNVGNGQTIVFHDKRAWKTVLYDVGVGYGRSKQLVSNYLKWAGINWINAIFISHHHDDHNNNLPIVKKYFNVKQVIQNNTKFRTFQFGGLKFTVLHKTINDEDENNNSLVLLVKINQYQILLTGDISKKIEINLLKEQLYPITLLQVPHHGSETSSSLVFLQKIMPKVCFISGEKTKRQNYPAPIVIENLKTIRCQIYFTNGKQNLQFNIMSASAAIKLF